MKSTPEVDEFTATLSGNSLNDSVSLQSEVPSTGRVDAFFFKSTGTLEVDVTVSGWTLITSGQMSGVNTYGIVGNYKCGQIKAKNFPPFPNITFVHCFTGLPKNRTGTQFVHVSAGTVTCVNGYGSFPSATVSMKIA